MLPVTQIDTFYNGLTLRHCDTINAAAGGTFMKRRPEECYDLIENMTAHHNDWDTFVQWSESSSSITSSSNPEIVALKTEMAKINKNLIKVLQINQQVKAVAHNCETCSGPHSYNDCPTTTNMTSLINSNLELKNMFGQFIKMNTASPLGSGTLPSNTITNPKEDLKGITTRSGNAYQGPTIPTTSSPPKVVERETEVTKDTVPPTNNRSTKDVQPLVVQIESQILNSEPIVAPVVEPVEALGFQLKVVDPLMQLRQIHLTCLFSIPERLKADNTNLASHLPQSCLMLTLEGFPFITVNTKEYHSECSGNYHRDNA
nr:reverse transcriptase domain-containing protein [Tanacetum cinerariifolium]